jgi:cytochrome c oxidase assembly factor CtaG
VKYLLLALGFASLWIAVASPVAHLDHHLLTAHMVQHLVLMIVAAPLILFGVPPVRLKPLRIISTQLAFCWFAGTLTVIFWHIPAAFDLALRSHFWHEFEQVSFFLAGILFWWPVIQPLRRAETNWSVPLYLFFATLPCDALSAYLVFCGHIVYQPYLSGSGHFHLSPIEDQALAGALMWVSVTFAYLIPALFVTARLLSATGRRTAEVGAR